MRLVIRVLPLCFAAAMLGGCSMGAMMGGTMPERVATRPPAQGVASDLDGNLRQAQLLRLAGKHDEAIQILSQLTLVAADNPRVVGEYGKALAQKGRAQDATQFLRRAVELSPDDWSVYSALGVAYDQLGDHVSARAAYERALLLRPGEAAVLNNYALSRMMAKDPDGARRLIAMAEGQGTSADERIARNVELINRMAGAAAPAAERPVAVAAPQPPVAVAAQSAPAPVAVQPAAPPIALSEAPPPPANDAAIADVALAIAEQTAQASSAPRALMPPQQQPSLMPGDVEQAALAVAEQMAPPPERRVVMQAVPFDPLAGPVKPRPRATGTAKKPAQTVPALRVAAGAY